MVSDDNSSSQPKAKRWVQHNDTRLKKVIELLEAHQGRPEPPSFRDGLQVLVVTILSQNTTDPNALQAYLNLLEQFPPEKEYDRDPSKLPRDEEGNIDPVAIRMSQAADALPPAHWPSVLEADAETVEDCISVCGLQQSKTATIQRALSWVSDQTGGYDLSEIIDQRSPAEAAKKLAEVKGIGVKTAAVTLMEAYQIDLCPVDTHVHRISQRLRLVEPSGSRDKTFRELQPIIPEGEGYSLHHNLLTFGREVCTAQNPNCESCFLNRVCYYYRCEEGGEDLTTKFS
jgi:endonuclease-3